MVKKDVFYLFNMIINTLIMWCVTADQRRTMTLGELRLKIKRRKEKYVSSTSFNWGSSVHIMYFGLWSYKTIREWKSCGSKMGIEIWQKTRKSEVEMKSLNITASFSDQTSIRRIWINCHSSGEQGFNCFKAVKRKEPEKSIREIFGGTVLFFLF